MWDLDTIKRMNAPAPPLPEIDGDECPVPGRVYQCPRTSLRFRAVAVDEELASCLNCAFKNHGTRCNATNCYGVTYERVAP